MPDDKIDTEMEQSGPRYQRARIVVPNPRAWLQLGEPKDIGYRGVSLGADDHAFLSVKGSTLTQAKGQVFHMAGLEWGQAASGDMTLNSGAHQMIASKLQVVLAAGAGYAPDSQLENGVHLPEHQFNPSDYKDIIEPCANGVREFDDDLKQAFNDFLDQSGVELPSGATTGAAAALVAEAKKQSRILKLLIGTPDDPTENSDSIEQFARKHGGLLGLLETASNVTNRLERWASRPETLPRVGKIIGHIQSLQPAIRGVAAAARAASLMGTEVDEGRGGLSTEYGREMGDARAKVQMIAHGTGARDWAGWADQGNAVAELVGQGLPHLMRPVANRIRALSVVLADVRSAVASLAGLKGLAPPPSSLALVGKDGVSLISPKRVFGYAADGFHFVTSRPVKSVPTGWSPLKELSKKVTDLLLGAPPPEAVPVPGFHVRSQGDVDFRSQKDISLWAIAPQSRARVTSNFAAELSAMHSAGISARMGTAEVLGKNVVIGSMVERAKAAAAAVLAGAAVDEADKLHAACVTRMNATEKKLAEKAEELRTALLGQSGSLLMNPATRAEATTLKAAHDALLMEYLVEIRAEAPLKAQLGAARLAYKAALAAAPLESPLARAMKWDGKEVQAIAENIEMASAKKLGVYGKEVSVESAGPIKLQAEPPLPGLPGKGTVSITSSQVEINVSDKFKVVVSEKGVSIQAGAQTILETNGVTATLALGGSSVTLTKAELSLESVTTNLKGGTINLG